MRWAAITAVLTLAAIPAAASAHHSLAVYDREKAIRASGVLTKLEISNPHSMLQVEFRTKAGETVAWTFEGAAASGMNRMGVTHDTLSVGDAVKLTGYPSRSGDRQAWLTRIETPQKVYDFSFRARGKPPKPVPAT